jgi:hypothetical protein
MGKEEEKGRPWEGVILLSLNVPDEPIILSQNPTQFMNEPRTFLFWMCVQPKRNQLSS